MPLLSIWSYGVVDRLLEAIPGESSKDYPYEIRSSIRIRPERCDSEDLIQTGNVTD